ncbi:MAG: flavin-binding protein dodecin [Alteromonadaceae bacterium]|jgi:flavin-binding protein dodecin
MSNHTYKTIEITGTSPDGIQQAIENGIADTSKSVRNMRWFEVTDTRGQIADGAVSHWQVTMKIGFTIGD